MILIEMMLTSIKYFVMSGADILVLLVLITESVFCVLLYSPQCIHVHPMKYIF